MLAIGLVQNLLGYWRIRGMLAEGIVELERLLERLVGVGDLLLESAGEHGQSRFSDIRDPEAVQLEIYRQMEANDRRRAGYAYHPR